MDLFDQHIPQNYAEIWVNWRQRQNWRPQVSICINVLWVPMVLLPVQLLFCLKVRDRKYGTKEVAGRFRNKRQEASLLCHSMHVHSGVTEQNFFLTLGLGLSISIGSGGLGRSKSYTHTAVQDFISIAIKAIRVAQRQHFTISSSKTCTGSQTRAELTCSSTHVPSVT